MPKKLTDTEFKQRVYKLVGNEYTFLEEYVNTRTKLKVRHNVCNNVYSVKPRDFLSNKRCPYCSGKLKKTTQQFKDEVYNLVGDEYSVLGEYKNNSTKIKMQHNKCGNTFEMRPNNFLLGQRCPMCMLGVNTNHRTKTIEEFKDEIKKLVGNNYILKSKYANSKTKVDLLHTKCNQIYRVTPSDFLFNGHRCSCEQHLKGETKIKEYLDNHKIKYEQHKRFDWLKYDKPQHLDFYLEDYNLAIEYDGVQHFELVNFSGKKNINEQEQDLKNNILKDNNKNKLLKEHSIKLIRIPYYKFDSIDSILDKGLKTK